MIMDKKDTKKLQLTPVEDMITEDFGKEGTSSRMEFEAGVDAFILGEKLIPLEAQENTMSVQSM